MYYPTICVHFNIYLSNNSVAPLTINESSYIMTIIKPNNMTYHYQPPQQKQIGVGSYIHVTRLVPVF